MILLLYLLLLLMLLLFLNCHPERRRRAPRLRSRRTPCPRVKLGCGCPILAVVARVGQLTLLTSPNSVQAAYFFAFSICTIFACHSAGPVWCTLVPLESTATVTGISSTVNS